MARGRKTTARTEGHGRRCRKWPAGTSQPPLGGRGEGGRAAGSCFLGFVAAFWVPALKIQRLIYLVVH